MSSAVQGGSGLRVAMLAPISWRVPPRHYGLWEQFVSLLTEGSSGEGSMSPCSRPPTREHGLVWWALHRRDTRRTWDWRRRWFERADEFDLIHNNFDFLPLTYSRLVDTPVLTTILDTPVLTTIHGFSSEQIVPVFEKYNRLGYYVAISESDRHEKPDYLATIHHGVEMDEFELGSGEGGYLLYFGRIHPDKRTVEAFEVAEETAIPLILAGIIQDQSYFDRFVAPRVDGERVTYVGPVEAGRRSVLLGGSQALLHLINFDEPFGFSVIESMACGTPVIATARGSMPEIIRHGETGFLVSSHDEAVEAVQASTRLDRQAIRASVEHRFAVGRMVEACAAASA